MPTVQNNLSTLRFEIYEDGREAGFLQYQMRGREMWFLHTQMSPGTQTPALIDTLIRSAVDSAFRHRVAVQPFCPLVRKFVSEHPHYLGLVPVARRSFFHPKDAEAELRRGRPLPVRNGLPMPSVESASVASMRTA